MAQTADEWKQLGNTALSAGNPQEAIDCYTKAIELNPNDHVFYSNRSAACLSLDEAEKALADAEKCIDMQPHWVKGYARKGAALHALKDYPKALEVYEKGLEIEPQNAACVSGKQQVEALVASERERERDGEGSKFNPFGNVFGADMFGKIATNPRISHFLQDAAFLKKLQDVQRDPSKMSAYLQDPRMMTVFGELLGLNLNDSANKTATHGQDDITMDDSEHGAPQAPRAQTSFKASAATKEEEQLSEEEQSAKQKKHAAENAKSRGNGFYKEKQFDQAITCYNEAILMDPENISIYTNRAAVYIELCQFDKCIEDCEKAIEIGRSVHAEYAQIAKAYIRIGNAYLKQGEDTEDGLLKAIDAYEKAQMENRTKEMDRKIKELQLKLKKVREAAYIDPEKALVAKEEGNGAFKDGKFPLAVEKYTEAIKRDPSKAVYYANRAAAYTKLTCFVEAKKDCEKALEIDPNYVKAYSRMGAIQFFMKEFHKARETYEKGLALDPQNEECQQGLRNVFTKIQSGETDDERAAHGLADPDIQAILRDPVIQNVLNDFQNDPRAAQKHLQNASIRTKIEKLIAAGVLQMK